MAIGLRNGSSGFLLSRISLGYGLARICGIWFVLRVF